MANRKSPIPDSRVLSSEIIVRLDAISSKQLTPRQVAMMLDDPSYRVQISLLQTYRLAPAQVLVLLRRSEAYLRAAAVRYCKLSTKMLNDALTDSDPSVRQEALRTHGERMSVKQLQFALADSDPHVRTQATRIWFSRVQKEKGRFTRHATTDGIAA